ncbi:MAG: ribosomal protein S18-alanine N-acetyltransferase [Clostridia bacterium]|nr:ribosomal protein S18-alanine N-acetyltransferase [Clostridia bacterium]
MSLDDLNKIASNLNNFDDFWTFGIFKEELINPKCHYIVAVQDEDILGFGGISVVLDEANINNIAVRFDKRNNKIGSKILLNLIDISKLLNCSFITLEVNVKNLPAIKLYENFGFKNLGIRKNYYNGQTDAYIMKLEFEK